MNKKCQFVIVIVEIIILLGLSGYRMYEYLNKDKEEIKENENSNSNNKEDEKDNISNEEQTNRKIKILVQQINIRKEANETSEDIGDVLLNETYEVLEEVDSINYTWYKINKNGVVGYIANQKGQNWIEKNYKTLYFYVQDGQLYIDEHNNNKDYIESYKCESEYCSVIQKNSYFAIISDSKVFLYDSKTKEKKDLNIEKNNCKLSFVEYEDKTYGIACFGGHYNDEFYYSLSKNNILYDKNILFNSNLNYEKTIEIEYNLPYIVIYKRWNTEKKDDSSSNQNNTYYYDNNQMEVIDVRTENIVLKSNDIIKLRKINIQNINYYISIETGNIYDSNYKSVANFTPNLNSGCENSSTWMTNNCSQFNYLNNTNNLTVIKDNQYIVYDKNMKEIYKSDKYEQIYLIKDYVITIKDGKIYILDLNGKVITEIKLNEKESKITGVLHDKTNKETFKIAINGDIYYYTPSTGESGVEYSDGYLNVESDLIKNLKIPYRAEFNVVKFNELALKYNHLSNNYDFDFDNEDNSTISALILNYYYYNNVFDSIPTDGGNYSITKKELEKEFRKLFGPDKKFQPTNVLSTNNFMCMSGGPYDYVEQEYLEKEERYLFKYNGCGMNIPYNTQLFVEPYSATKNNEDIIVFYRIAKIKKYIKKDDFGQLEKDDSTTIENINGNSLIKKVGVCDSVCEELLKNELKAENKLPIYKATFKKQSDGNYYFSKGEWQ